MNIEQLYNQLGKALKHGHGKEQVWMTGEDHEPVAHSWHAADGNYYIVGASVIEKYRKIGEEDL